MPHPIQLLLVVGTIIGIALFFYCINLEDKIAELEKPVPKPPKDKDFLVVNEKFSDYVIRAVGFYHISNGVLFYDAEGNVVGFAENPQSVTEKKRITE